MDQASISLSPAAALGDRFTLPGTEVALNRLGYGAMQLAGPGVFGPPRDPAGALEVLREVAAVGINHIDTSDFYGPYVTNRLICEALRPYPAGMVLTTKVGFLRGSDKSWYPAASASELATAVESNRRHLDQDALDIVNLRVGGPHGPAETSIAAPFAALADLQRRGLIRHLGLSNVTARQVAEARAIAPVVCVQNQYNLVHRVDDALIDDLAAHGIAYVPFFPLGGFTPLQSATLDRVATSLGATSMQVALAWLLQRSGNILLIPGTSSVAHLRENLKAGTLQLPPEAVAELDEITVQAGRARH